MIKMGALMCELSHIESMIIRVWRKGAWHVVEGNRTFRKEERKAKRTVFFGCQVCDGSDKKINLTSFGVRLA